MHTRPGRTGRPRNPGAQPPANADGTGLRPLRAARQPTPGQRAARAPPARAVPRPAMISARVPLVARVCGRFPATGGKLAGLRLLAGSGHQRKAGRTGRRGLHMANPGGTPGGDTFRPANRHWDSAAPESTVSADR